MSSKTSFIAVLIFSAFMFQGFVTWAGGRALVPGVYNCKPFMDRWADGGLTITVSKSFFEQDIRFKWNYNDGTNGDKFSVDKAVIATPSDLATMPALPSGQYLKFSDVRKNAIERSEDDFFIESGVLSGQQQVMLGSQISVHDVFIPSSGAPKIDTFECARN